VAACLVVAAAKNVVTGDMFTVVSDGIMIAEIEASASWAACR
jgi:hypothetical protein